MGQGVGRVWRPPAPRVERALPFSDEFWCFGPDKGTSIILVARQERLARRRQSDRGRAFRVRATPRPRNISHACVCARDTGACNHRCSSGGALRSRESSRERRGGDGAAPRAAAAARQRADAEGRGRRRHDGRHLRPEPPMSSRRERRRRACATAAAKPTWERNVVIMKDRASSMERAPSERHCGAGRTTTQPREQGGRRPLSGPPASGTAKDQAANRRE